MGKKKTEITEALDIVDANGVIDVGPRGDEGVDGGEASKQGKKDKKDKKSKKGKEQLEALGGTTEPPPDPGPLAPWRLSICIAGSAALTGQTLFDAAMSGVGIDGSLLRSFGVALALWIAVGFINRILLQAQQSIDAERAAQAELERVAEREARERARAAELESLAPKPWVETTGTESKLA